MKKENAITLISLVITIIVLIILAGITINILLGENGLLQRAKTAAKEYEYQTIKEKIESEILALDMDKVVKGETLTIEEALIGVQEKGIFEEIDIESNTGICEGYVIELGYNEDGKVVILGIEKDTGTRIVAKLNPTGYTNDKVEVSITVRASGQNITKIEVPTGMNQKAGTKEEDHIYEVASNGTYQVTAILEDGNTIEKDITIATIDRLAPKDFTPTIEKDGNKITIIPNGEDDEDEENVKSGIDYYEYYLDDEKQESNTIQGLSLGTHKIYVIAYDKATNSKTSKEVEVQISISISKISLSQVHMLVLDSEGNLWSKGDNEYGELGDGGTTNSNNLKQIEIGKKFKEIAASYKYSLAIDTEGYLWSWGKNTDGILANGIEDEIVSAPTKVSNDLKFQKIAVTNNQYESEFWLALDESGDIWGCGKNGYGQLGDGTNDRAKQLVKVQANAKFKDIAVGQWHSLAIDENGYLWSWGDNSYKQLGRDNISETDPSKVDNNLTFKAIACSESASFAIDVNGNLYSFGRNWNRSVRTKFTGK